MRVATKRYDELAYGGVEPEALLESKRSVNDLLMSMVVVVGIKLKDVEGQFI